ncbi:MAG: hypothetical protein LBP55_05795 [Candidatus Adiutrix sp.]|jgi:hypothetical protein|nr:hypothetical protein [Candidatus Adiutrix sp.]
MQFYRKAVELITLFFAGVSGVFLLTGTGTPGLRLMARLIFFISALNLSLHIREIVPWGKKVMHKVGLELAAFGKVSAENKPGGQSGGGEKRQPTERGHPPDGAGKETEGGRSRDKGSESGRRDS